ncbi:aldose epimerase family protein [Marinobacterium aestuariivivens]|uniref:Aldose 1-epimerase n=1 Tax=Marinobacterium aestuariivivens TaxID=1698799 RepID=A0ABW1ZUI5_9GAMM
MPNDASIGDRSPVIVTLRSELIRAELCSYGARLLALYLRNADGSETNIALALPSLEDYAAGNSSIGAICGRFANRIRNACYREQDSIVHLSANEGPNHLHGGGTGFDRQPWNTVAMDSEAVTFSLAVPDGDQGYPGALNARVTYRLLGAEGLQCRITASSDRPTIVNLTHHAYWNLTGDFSRSAADHMLQIDADAFLPVDDQLIPLPGRSPVARTAFDFREPALTRERLAGCGDGFDHNFCLNGPRGTLRPVARLEDPASGRSLRLSTSEAGLQFYLARHFTPDITSREGRPLHPAAGIALEPQTFPDSPNRPDFPSPRLLPGELYEHLIEWQFGSG